MHIYAVLRTKKRAQLINYRFKLLFYGLYNNRTRIYKVVNQFTGDFTLSKQNKKLTSYCPS